MTALQGPVDVAVARGLEAETLRFGSSTMRLLLDAGATDGAVSAHRVQLPNGAVGAGPHFHSRSSELFYVLKGSVDVLAGERVVLATQGDLVVVPPGVAHAFAASAGREGELLVLITPGVERFEFFRQLQRVESGDLDPSSLARSQPRYDNHPASSAAWSAQR